MSERGPWDGVDRGAEIERGVSAEEGIDAAQAAGHRVAGNGQTEGL